jgi:hypothetical protein
LFFPQPPPPTSVLPHGPSQYLKTYFFLIARRAGNLVPRRNCFDHLTGLSIISSAIKILWPFL